MLKNSIIQKVKPATHEEWLVSTLAGEGKKWIIEEADPLSGSGEARYMQVIDEERNPYATEAMGKAAARNAKAREQLKKKTSVHGKPYVYQLGYNHCIGRFSGAEDFPSLSGSSLNRKKKKQIKKDREPAERQPRYFTKRSRGKVKDKTTAFYRAIPGERIFLTLTFIQHVDDQLGKQILNKFLTVVRKETRGFQFLRIAEHQKENPMHTIHFHILMNRRLAVRRYNALWVLQQYNSGLRGKTKHGEPITFEEIQSRYQDGSIQKVLNPLDVRKAYGVNALASYLTKYVTKQDDKDSFDCLPWHCSRGVSKLFTREVVSRSTFSFMCSWGNAKLDRQTGEMLQPRVYSQQFFIMVYVNNKGAPLKLLQRLELANRWIIQNFEPDEVTRYDNELYRNFLLNSDDVITPREVVTRIKKEPGIFRPTGNFLPPADIGMRDNKARLFIQSGAEKQRGQGMTNRRLRKPHQPICVTPEELETLRDIA